VAKGAQDYTKRIDVIYQTIEEMIVRPRYGDFKEVSQFWSNPSTGWLTLANITGKGQTYGGLVSLTGTGATPTAMIEVTIDGEVVYANDFEDLLTYRMVDPYVRPFFLLHHNYVLRKYIAGFSPQISFENSYRIRFYVGYANQNIWLLFTYALI